MTIPMRSRGMRGRNLHLRDYVILGLQGAPSSYPIITSTISKVLIPLNQTSKSSVDISKRAPKVYLTQGINSTP